MKLNAARWIVIASMVMMIWAKDTTQPLPESPMDYFYRVFFIVTGLFIGVSIIVEEIMKRKR
jgi:hypothetical protein